MTKRLRKLRFLFEADGPPAYNEEHPLLVAPALSITQQRGGLHVTHPVRSSRP